METNGQPGRKPRLLVDQRKAIVEARMHDGMSVQAISSLKTPSGAKLGNYKTILKDYNEARSRMLEQDDQWFNRAREARIKATKKLESQYLRLLGIILSPGQAEYTSAEKTRCEALLTHTVDTLYSIESDFDPEQYYSGKLEALKNGQKIADSKNGDVQQNTGERGTPTVLGPPKSQ